MGKKKANGKKPPSGGRGGGSSQGRSHAHARDCGREDARPSTSTSRTGSGNNSNRKARGKRKRHRHHSHLDGGAAAAGASSSSSAWVMDDVMEQLRKQRARAKKEKETSSAGESAANRCNSPREEEGKEKNSTMGNFRYDPIKKGYFPVSSRRYSPNDAAPIGDCYFPDDDSKTRLEDEFDGDNMTMGNNVEQMALRMSTGHCANVNRVKNSNYSNHRIIFHAYHMANEFTNFSVFRHRLKSEMASTLLFTSGIHLRPAVQRRTIPGEFGGGEIWQSLLEPLPCGFESHSSEGGHTRPIPVDCLCKHELHPSARTFDVLESSSGQGELPHVVTIIGGGSNGSNLFYRNNRPGSDSPFALQVSPATNRSEVLSSARRHQCVRFAPFMAESRLRNNTSVVLGALSTDVVGRGNFSTFSLHRGPTNADVAMPFAAKELRSTEGNHNGIVVNDFVFSPNSTTAAPGLVAFAPAKKKSRPMFLDFETMRVMNLPTGWKHGSEALCVEHLHCANSNSILYGHRNGIVSILDYRANVSIYTSKTTESGSITSLLSLSKVGRPNEFLAKGSFGACRLFDIRKLSNTSGSVKDNRRAPALVHEMFYLGNKPLAQLANASSGCTGMVVDPSATTLISPCMKGGAEASVCLGLWNLTSGNFLRDISLSSDVQEAAVTYINSASTCNGAGDSIEVGHESRGCHVSPGSRCCEVIGANQIGWDNKQIGEGLRAWVKFDPQLPCTDGGAIHNIAIGC